MLSDILFTVIALIFIISILIFFWIRNKRAEIYNFEKVAITVIIVIITLLYGIVNYDSNRKMTIVSPEIMKLLSECIPCTCRANTITSNLSQSSNSEVVIQLMQLYQKGQMNAMSEIVNSQTMDVFTALTYLAKKKSELNEEIKKLKENSEKFAYKSGEIEAINIYLESIVQKVNKTMLD